MKKLDFHSRRNNITYLWVRQEGFTLVELMIALSILMLIVFAFTPLLLGSIERIHYAGDKSEALYHGQADMEVRIVEKDTVDEYELIFDFGSTVIEVPGGLIEVEKTQGSAETWLGTFLPYVPSIKLSDNFPVEGYDAPGDGYPIVVMGRDTRLDEDDYVYIYTREGFEDEEPERYRLDFQLIDYPQDVPEDLNIPGGYDQYALFHLPEGLTNANSHYIVEFEWMIDEMLIKVRARLQVSPPYAVAVGNEEIVVSPDASETWNVRHNDVSLDNVVMNDITYAFFKYIAVTSDGSVLSWGNREEPHKVNIPEANNKSLNSIAYAEGKLVAVGDQGTVVVSTDGQNWTRETVMVAGGEHEEENGEEETNGEVTNGEENNEEENSGEESPVEKELTVDLQSVHYNGNKFMAVGKAGTVITSDDGSEWTDHSLTVDDAHLRDFNGLTYGNGSWVVVGTRRPADPAESRFYIIHRGTPGNLDEIDSGSGGSILCDVSYNNPESGSGLDPRFVAVGNSGRILHSPDGTAESWKAAASGTENVLNRIIWDSEWNEIFIVAGDGGTVLTGDGNSWNKRATGSSRNLKGVAIRWGN